MKKIYCLYSDSKQTRLMAMAYSLDERKEVTKEYTSGQWFSYECDKDKDHIIYKDTEKKVRCKFPEVASLTKKEYTIDNNIKMKNDGTDLRV